MRILLTTDLHNTARPEHAYRLQYLEWLLTVVREQNINAVVICGDLTDAKDFHSGALVNAITDRLAALARVVPVHILYGNHDGPSPDRAFWAFMRHIPGINYYTQFAAVWGMTRNEPTAASRATLMVPWGAEDAMLSWIATNPTVEPQLILMHATVNKAVVESGIALESPLPSKFLPPTWKKVRVFSGDVHVPQMCGDVQYIGTPYHVHYGDNFTPRTLIWDNDADAVGEGRFPDAPELQTWRLRELCLGAFDVPQGTRVKLVVNIDYEVLPQDWQAFVQRARSELTSKGIELTSALLERKTLKRAAAPSIRRSDEAIVRTYGENQQLDKDAVEVGVSLTKEST